MAAFESDGPWHLPTYTLQFITDVIRAPGPDLDRSHFTTGHSFDPIPSNNRLFFALFSLTLPSQDA